jgi:hypothetical protein
MLVIAGWKPLGKSPLHPLLLSFFWAQAFLERTSRFSSGWAPAEEQFVAPLEDIRE